MRLGSLLAFAAAILGSFVLFVPAASPTPPAGYQTIRSGTATGGVHWELAVRRVRLSGFPGLCLVLDVQQPGGFGTQGKHCAAGSIARANVEPLATGLGSGTETIAKIVGGFAVGQARKVTITFANGKRQTVPARLGPPAWRRALGTQIRFFAADCLRVTSAAPRWIAIYNSRGKRIGRVKLGQ